MPIRRRSDGFAKAGAWVVVRAPGAAEVLKAAGDPKAQPLDRAAAAEAAIADGQIVVTPAVDGWVLVAGSVLGEAYDFDATWLIEPKTPVGYLLARLACAFPRWYLFVASASSERLLWARVVGGSIERLARFEQGTPVAEIGAPTPIELLVLLPNEHGYGLAAPDDAFAVADAWGPAPGRFNDLNAGTEPAWLVRLDR